VRRGRSEFVGEPLLLGRGGAPVLAHRERRHPQEVEIRDELRLDHSRMRPLPAWTSGSALIVAIVLRDALHCVGRLPQGRGRQREEQQRAHCANRG
jgi:hypothetical protein